MQHDRAQADEEDTSYGFCDAHGPFGRQKAKEHSANAAEHQQKRVSQGKARARQKNAAPRGFASRERSDGREVVWSKSMAKPEGKHAADCDNERAAFHILVWYLVPPIRAIKEPECLCGKEVVACLAKKRIGRIKKREFKEATMKIHASLTALALVIVAAQPVLADTASKSSDVKPIPKAEQEKLNKAIGNEQDAKIKVAPIGQSDKDNINKAVNWVEEKLKIRPTKKSSKAESAEATTTPVEK
jgi:hypothetical protein